MSGLFIVLEGIDGSGKSTQQLRLAERLEKSGQRIRMTHEPTDGPCGDLVKKVMRGEIELNETAIALLFAADRADHLNVISKHLHADEVVLSDRHLLSSLAYNSSTLPREWVLAINAPIRAQLRPHLTILLDLPAETALERIQQRSEPSEHYEKLDALKSIRERYLTLAHTLTDEHILILDGEENPDVIAEQIWQAITPLLQEHML